MELKQDDFLKNRDEDLRNSADYDASADNDQIGENSEQTPLAKALQEEKQSNAENKGWENNKPGITTENENNQQVPAVTPQNDNGLPGPEDDDFDDDDDDDDLIPIETDDDDDFLSDDDDDDVDDLLDDDDDIDKDVHAHKHVDVSKIVPNPDRPFGRTTGRMIDHEPGTTNNPE